MNLELASEGHAVVYTQFLRKCPDTDNALLAAEAQAPAAAVELLESAQFGDALGLSTEQSVGLGGRNIVPSSTIKEPG